MNEIRCRPAGTEDFTFLATMLGEAAVWRPDKPTPTAEQVMADLRYALYLNGWPRQGDYGLVAEQDGPVGAAWYRTYTEHRRRLLPAASDGDDGDTFGEHGFGARVIAGLS